MMINIPQVESVLEISACLTNGHFPPRVRGVLCENLNYIEPGCVLCLITALQESFNVIHGLTNINVLAARDAPCD